MDESGAKAQLQQGLAALKQGRAAEAIALLNAAGAGLEGADRARALAGLVGAYRAAGQWTEAIALCDHLLQHPSPQVRQWATQARSQLPAQAPAAAPEPQNLQNLQQNSQQNLQKNLQKNLQNLTDRVDLSPAPADGPPPDPSGFATGFVPLSEPIAAGQRTQVVRVAMESPAPPSDRPSESTDRPTAPPPPVPKAVVSAVTAAPASELIAQPSRDPSAPEPYEVEWRNAPKADHHTALPQTAAWTNHLSQAIALVLLVMLVQQVAIVGVSSYNRLMDWCMNALLWLPIWGDMPPSIEGDVTWPVVIGLGLVFAGSPWLLDEVLRRWGSQPRKFSELVAERPETARQLQRLARSHQQPVPHLHLLTTAAPVVMVYGWWPSQMRLAIAQGAIDRLTDGELASLVAAQYSQAPIGDAAVASWATAALMLPYGLYVLSAQAAETWQLWPAKIGAIGFSALSYGVYRLERWALLGWSRSRQLNADRQGAAQSGDPNALARALVKCSAGLAEQFHTDQAIGLWLESLEFLLPIEPRTAITEGSFQPVAPLEPLWVWGRRHPYRQWLQLNQSHPPTGHRMAQLAELAVRWKLEPEFEMSDRSAQAQQQRYLPPLAAARLSRPLKASALWMQSAPWVGGLLGIGLAITLWTIGGLGLLFKHPIGWMWGDRTLIWGLGWMGCGLGIFLRINRFFPEIRSGRAIVFAADGLPLASALTEPNALPIDGLMVKVSGVLLGRSGWANGLWQDLWLQTPSGTLPLHLASRGGWLGCLVHQGREELPIGRSVVVTGWLRRSSTPWIDVEALNLLQGKLTSTTSLVTADAHPLRSVVLGAIAVIAGFSILMRFGWF
jgi:Zn-dependent protease with chaperone function